MGQLGVARRSIGVGCDIFCKRFALKREQAPSLQVPISHRLFVATGLVIGAALRPSGDESPRHNGLGDALDHGKSTFLQAKKKTLNFKVFL